MSSLQFPPFISAFFQGLHKNKKQRFAREQKDKDLQKKNYSYKEWLTKAIDKKDF